MRVTYCCVLEISVVHVQIEAQVSAFLGLQQNALCHASVYSLARWFRDKCTNPGRMNDALGFSGCPGTIEDEQRLAEW